ncbi:MAG: hypothetical protein JRE28_10325 [Deltaproteobacteria bacterium]|nr:hypothetical protein [Deltaproteobacteria bacterium]
MKQVTMIQTRDGKLHPTENAARHHADQQYTNAVYQIAGQLFNLIHGNSRVADIAEYIDQNLPAFAALEPLRADMEAD